MSKGFWEYVFTPKQHSCELRDCEVHKYFRDSFTKLQQSVNKIETHSCNTHFEALKSLAERFEMSEKWVSKLHERIDKLEKLLKEDE